MRKLFFLIFILSNSILTQAVADSPFQAAYNQTLLFPIYCPEDLPCNSSSKTIKIFNPQNLPTFFSLTFDSRLPHGVELNSRSGAITWAPSDIEDFNFSIQLKPSSESTSPPLFISVTIKSFNPANVNGANDFQRECDKANAANYAAGVTDANESTLWANLYLTDIQLTMLGQNKFDSEEHLYGNHLIVLYQNLLSTFGKTPATSLEKAVLKTYTHYVPDIEISNYARQKNPSAISYASRSMFSKNMLGSFIVQLKGWDLNHPSGPPYGIAGEAIVHRLLGTLSSRGISQANLFFLNVLGAKDKNDQYIFKGLRLFDINPNDISKRDQLIQRFGNDSSTIFESKTTPSLACNNAASAIAQVPVSWKKLGMITYSGYQWLPYVHPAITQAIGPLIKENPTAYELFKIVPLIGTALSIADGMLTWTEGKDMYGIEQSKFVSSAFLFLDLWGVGLGEIGIKAVKAAKLAKYLDEVKQLQTLPRTVEGARSALVGSIQAIKTLIRKSDDVVGCVLSAATPGLSARPMLKDKLLKGATVGNEFGNIKCEAAKTLTEANLILDSNVILDMAASMDPKKMYDISETTFIAGRSMQEVADKLVIAKGGYLYVTDAILEEMKNNRLFSKLGINPEEFFKKYQSKMKLISPQKTEDESAVWGIVEQFGIGDESVAHSGALDRQFAVEGILPTRHDFGSATLTVGTTKGTGIRPVIVSSDKGITGKLLQLGGRTDEKDLSKIRIMFMGIFPLTDVVLTQSSVVSAFENILGMPASFLNGQYTKGILRDLSALPFKVLVPIATCEKLKALYKSNLKNLVVETAADYKRYCIKRGLPDPFPEINLP